MSVKEFTDIIGGHGPWQLGIYTFFLFCSAPHCFHNLIMTFFAPNIEYWCSQSSEKNVSDHCTYQINGSTMKCSAWEYSPRQDTMVEEWDLVCDREWLISLAKTVYMVGFLVSVTFCGQLSDRFGRRPVVIICLCVFLIAALLTLISSNFIMFIILRFFVALGLTSVFTVSYVVLTEVISAEHRSAYCFTFKLGWVFAYMLLPGIAWFLPGWFWLQCAITLPWIALLCVFWVIPETPRWLLTHGKMEEAEKVLMNAARKNGKNLEEAKEDIKLLIAHSTKMEEKGNETVLDLLRTPGLRRNTILIYIHWFVISYIYYALSWNTNDLGGNPYLTFFICGAVELPATLIFLALSRKVGHRMALLVANISAGICLLLILAVKGEIAIIILSMAGKFFNSGSFDVVYVYSAEIFPTVVRNVGVGSSSTWARVGALLAPFMRQLADATHPSVPIAVPGALSILTGLVLLAMPETKGKKLPDTLQEAEEFSGKWKLYKVTYGIHLSDNLPCKVNAIT